MLYALLPTSGNGREMETTVTLAEIQMEKHMEHEVGPGVLIGIL